MFMIRFNPGSTDQNAVKSMIGIARKCRQAILDGMSPDMDATIVNLTGQFDRELAHMRLTHRLVTVGDWADSLFNIFAHGSDFCPQCGTKSFSYPVLHCPDCGANPGTVVEEAGGIEFLPLQDPRLTL